MQTATLVQVQACSNDGDLSPVGTVNVLPLVNQIDGSIPPNSQPHITVYGLPYLRVQGGSNAVIIDPQPGDIGIAVFASRDISGVKATKAQANPGSQRSYDFADGIYMGGVLNGSPTRYIQFSGAGITINDPSIITLQAPSILLKGAVTQSDGDVSMTGNLSVADNVTVMNDTISVKDHVHTSAPVGTPTSGPIG